MERYLLLDGMGEIIDNDVMILFQSPATISCSCLIWARQCSDPYMMYKLTNTISQSNRKEIRTTGLVSIPVGFR